MPVFNPFNIFAIEHSSQNIDAAYFGTYKFWPPDQTVLFSPEDIALIPNPDVWKYNYSRVVFFDGTTPRDFNMYSTTTAHGVLSSGYLESGKATFEAEITAIDGESRPTIYFFISDIEAIPDIRSLSRAYRSGIYTIGSTGAVRKNFSTVGYLQSFFKPSVIIGLEADRDNNTVVFVVDGIRSKEFSVDADKWAIGLAIISGVGHVRVNSNFGQTKPKQRYSHSVFGWPMGTGRDTQYTFLGGGWGLERPNAYISWGFGTSEVSQFIRGDVVEAVLEIKEGARVTRYDEGRFRVILRGIDTSFRKEIRYASDGEFLEVDVAKDVENTSQWESFEVGDVIRVVRNIITNEFQFFKNDVLQGSTSAEGFRRDIFFFSRDFSGGHRILLSVNDISPEGELPWVNNAASTVNSSVQENAYGANDFVNGRVKEGAYYGPLAPNIGPDEGVSQPFELVLETVKELERLGQGTASISIIVPSNIPEGETETISHLRSNTLGDRWLGIRNINGTYEVVVILSGLGIDFPYLLSEVIPGVPFALALQTFISPGGGVNIGKMYTHIVACINGGKVRNFDIEFQDYQGIPGFVEKIDLDGGRKMDSEYKESVFWLGPYHDFNSNNPQADSWVKRVSNLTNSPSAFTAETPLRRGVVLTDQGTTDRGTTNG